MTADEIYQLVRARLPRISLGTVYRNLKILSQLGIIQKLEVAGGQKRFDAKTRDHYHMRCLDCASIEDAPIKVQIDLDHLLEGLTEYEIIGHRLEFLGFCPNCRRKPGVRKTERG
jgi:Fur family ferric uptake transcriptional regulator